MGKFKIPKRDAAKAKEEEPVSKRPRPDEAEDVSYEINLSGVPNKGGGGVRGKERLLPALAAATATGGGAKTSQADILMKIAKIAERAGAPREKVGLKPLFSLYVVLINPPLVKYPLPPAG